jgi:hypothetical protein
MPWTENDVEKHKKGLSATQKRQWVHVANGVLAKCKADGGDDASCAPRAIREANGVTGNNEMQIYNQPSSSYEAQHRDHQGRRHIVVPVTMLVEGVHIGSHGSILHRLEEFGKEPDLWNGRPVTIEHPEVQGVNVSANHPDMAEVSTVGTIYNAHIDRGKLKAEAWIDEERLRQVSPEALTSINAATPLEVSTGLFSEEVPEQGRWNGERYNAIARNYRPDHLALLPGGRGACSLDDGCGIRANSNKKGGKNDMVNKEEKFSAMQALKDEGWSITDIMDNTTKGLLETLEALRKKVDTLDSSTSIHFLREAYDDHVIYEVSNPNGGSKLYKQEYVVTNSGNIEFNGRPVEVQKRVEYISVNKGGSFIRTKPPIKLEVNTMADNKCPKCVEKINALIANSASGFVEADREWLDTLSETAIDKIVPKTEIKTEIQKETVEVNKLTDEQTRDLAWAAGQRKAKRTALVNGIQANEETKKLWPDTVLNALSEEDLERVYKTVTKKEPVDYSINAGAPEPIVNKSTKKPLLPTGFGIAKKEDVTKK